MKNGNCQWTETVSESIWISHYDSSKELEEHLFKFVVSMVQMILILENISFDLNLLFHYCGFEFEIGKKENQKLNFVVGVC